MNGRWLTTVGELRAAEIGAAVRFRRPSFGAPGEESKLVEVGRDWAEGTLLCIKDVRFLRNGAYERAVVLVIQTADGEAVEVGPLYAEHRVDVNFD